MFFQKIHLQIFIQLGLLGEQYIGLEAGGDPDNLEANDKITQTQDAVVLEKLISQFLYNQASKEDE